jgi:CRP-like cAMP-binding protein
MSAVRAAPSSAASGHDLHRPLATALRAIPEFAALSDGAPAALAPHAAEMRCAAGQPVLLRADPADALMILVQGRLMVTVASPEGRALAFRLMTPVDLVGEIGALDALPRSADVVAAADSLLLRLPRQAVLAAIRAHPDFAEGLIRLLCRRLRETNRDFEGLATLRLEARLALLLLRLADSVGEAQPGGAVLLPRRLSQTELSLLVAATREAVNKQLGAWREAGLVALDHGRIAVLRRDTLAALHGEAGG